MVPSEFGVSVFQQPRNPRVSSLRLANTKIPTCETPKWHSVFRVWMFRCFGTRETQGSVTLYSLVAKFQLVKPQNELSDDYKHSRFTSRETEMRDLFSLHIAKSRLAKPRDDRVWIDFDVSAFRHTGILRVSFLVFARGEIPM
jgi:hypothetical protein